MKMAWRNIWRNPRRTFVILSAVFFGVTGMLFMAALMKGMVYSMVENNINNLTGHVLIRNIDFVSDPSVENRLNDVDAMLAKVQDNLPKGGKAVKRIRLDGVVNTARDSFGVTVVGTDIKAEEGISFIGDAPFKGGIITENDKNTVMIGKALSETIGLEMGKRIVLNLQGADGEIVARSFHIKGIFTAGQEQLEKAFIFIPFDSAADMLGIAGDGTEISVDLPIKSIESKEYMVLTKKLQTLFPDNVSVMSWREVLPAVNAYLKLFDGFIYIWYLMIFIAMGFGIVNTVLMAVYERMREFGLLRALGVKTSGIFRMVLTETGLLILTGLVAGNIAAYGLIWILSVNGLDLTAFARGMDILSVSRVIYPVFTLSDLIKADVTVFLLGMIIALYPAFKACGFSPVETMRNV